MICENSNFSESDRDRSGNMKSLCVDRLMGLFNRRDIKELRHGFEEGLNCVNTEAKEKVLPKQEEISETIFSM